MCGLLHRIIAVFVHIAQIRRFFLMILALDNFV